MIFIFLSNFLVMYFIKFLTPFACSKLLHQSFLTEQKKRLKCLRKKWNMKGNICMTFLNKWLGFIIQRFKVQRKCGRIVT